MAQHKEISVAEFFEKNRHLLGFSNKQKAITTCIKEAVDNSLDAAEDDRVLPEVRVYIENYREGRLRFKVMDNAHGIEKKHIPKVFGKLLYGSKFHSLRQSRGQQGVGISAAGLYAQLTTGNPIKVVSKLVNGKIHSFEVKIDTEKNEPEVLADQVIDNYEFDHGTSIEMDIEGVYTRGPHSVLSYLKQTAIMNPYARIILKEPDGTIVEFPRATEILPPLPKEIKPHPQGVELGILMRMIKKTTSRTVSTFLKSEFTRVGSTSAKEICEKAELSGNERPSSLSKENIEKLLEAMQSVRLQAPPTDCLSPIGEGLIVKGLQKELNPEFVCAVTRTPSVYRGMPFQIEAGIAYGGDIAEERAQILRFANKVPLLYKASACVTNQAIRETDWSRYGLKQSAGTPQGPVYILLHMCSVWVPYTSEGKEAIADYPEILKEMKLALQEAGRRLKLYLGKMRRAEIKEKKFKKLLAYSKEMAPAISKLVEEVPEDKVYEEMEKLLKETYIEVI